MGVAHEAVYPVGVLEDGYAGGMPDHSSRFVTHLESAIDGTILPDHTVQTVHEGRPIVVRYDLEGVCNALNRDELATRASSMWRYRELLPVEDANIVSLGESMTPLLSCARLGKQMGLANLLIKDESSLPTGSFKARGMAVAVSMAKQLGLTRLAAPTAGNAGGALAAYAGRAGMECFLFMPEDTPVVNQYEAALYGARVFLVNGLISDCGRMVREGMEEMEWFDMSTLKEPYRLEGKKTMGLELAEQLGWTLPDAIFYPTGGGTGLIGMVKAFAELRELGWLENDIIPRMYACQSTGCSPIVNAFEAKDRFAEPIENAHTVASGLRVPGAVGDFMILDALWESGGAALGAEDSSIRGWMNRVAAEEGIAICPETAICFSALERAVAEGLVKADERVVVFNTGAGQKYVEVLERDLPRIDCGKEVDYSSLA